MHDIIFMFIFLVSYAIKFIIEFAIFLIVESFITAIPLLWHAYCIMLTSVCISFWNINFWIFFCSFAFFSSSFVFPLALFKHLYINMKESFHWNFYFSGLFVSHLPLQYLLLAAQKEILENN